MTNLSSRVSVKVSNGMVASSHELASFHGSRILADGGNVVDAAITTSAVLCVTQNNLCGLGGDLFALIKFDGKILNLNGSGRASESATIDFYKKENKLSKIPDRGPLAAPTVPGIVHALGEMHSKFGSVELKKLLEPAISCARNGFPITANYSNSIRATLRILGNFKGWTDIFAPGGKIPETGFILRQSDLANTLEQIAAEGPSTFYEGNLSEKISGGIAKQGGLITENDLKRHKSTWQDPIKTDYRGTTVHETSPNSQAATVLLWLNMLEEYDLKRYSENNPKLLEIMLETCLLAYEQRAKHIGDFELPDEFTTKQFAKGILEHRSKRAKRPTAKRHSGDTTYFCVGRQNGDSISVIQSNYMGFGSGLVPEGTGFVLHNRGSYFSLDENHHNSTRPGKRTFHTLCASLGESSQKTSFAIGSMGGDIQPQVHVQLMSRILDFGMDPQAAIDSPRWIIPFTIYEKPSAVYLEPGYEVQSSVVKKIVRKMRLSFKEFDSFSSLTGHAQAILFKESYLTGGADPRGDGAVVGF